MCDLEHTLFLLLFFSVWCVLNRKGTQIEKTKFAFDQEFLIPFIWFIVFKVHKFLTGILNTDFLFDLR